MFKKLEDGLAGSGRCSRGKPPRRPSNVVRPRAFLIDFYFEVSVCVLGTGHRSVS